MIPNHCRLYMVVCIGICFMSPLCLSTSVAKATRVNHIFRAFNIFVLIYQLSIWKKNPLFSRLIQWGNLLEAFQISLRMAERLLEAQLKPLGMAGEQLQVRDQHQITTVCIFYFPLHRLLEQCSIARLKTSLILVFHQTEVWTFNCVTMGMLLNSP